MSTGEGWRGGGEVVVTQQLTVGLRGTKAEQEATTEARMREDKTFMAKGRVLCVWRGGGDERSESDRAAEERARKVARVLFRPASLATPCRESSKRTKGVHCMVDHKGFCVSDATLSKPEGLASEGLFPIIQNPAAGPFTPFDFTQHKRRMRARLLLIKAYFTCQSFIFFFTCLVFRQIVCTQTQKQVISYLTSPPPLSPLPTPFPSSSLSNRYSGQHRDVLVEGMVLEHALGDENVLNLPQHVLAKVAAHDLRVSKENNK